MNDQKLANKLKVFRAMRDLTQQQLADLCGLSRKSVNAIECGRFIPSTVTALALAKALDAKVEELFWVE